MSGSVPTVTALDEIYTQQALLNQGSRWKTLLDKFQHRYGGPALFVARSPGRVNIIGEHIDYSLYSVLPMGITPDVILAISVTQDSDSTKEHRTHYKLEIANIDEEQYPARKFEVAHDGGEIEIDATKHEWTNYFKAGLRGALQLLRKKYGASLRPKSMKILMDGTVPAGGGLSSSAAFVSASALAVMVANGENDVAKKDLTEVAIVSERTVGVNSGGMDQSASVFSERGSALFVSFTPTLSARPISFPKTNPELMFMVAQSFVTSNKQVTGPIHYNLRVVECSMAAAVLNAILCPQSELPEDAGPLGISLHGFHTNYFKDTQKTMTEQLEELIQLTESVLTNTEGYNLEEAAAAANTTVEDIKARFMSSFPVRSERFKLRQRALHVFTEALRVIQFLYLLENKMTTQGNPAELSKKLGDLMNRTQDSCRELYECSCPEIDELCMIAREAGSYGSRLTGAGWGGCSVHLIAADKVDTVREALVNKYYSKRNLSERDVEAAIVVSRPMNGSAVFKLEPQGGSI